MLGKTDVVVIGGGVIGCAVAYYLAKKGARVTLIEESVIGSGASSANSGAIAMATKKPGLALDMAMASQRLYPALGSELGMDMEYSVQGNLIVAESETEAIYLEKLSVEQQSAGVPAEMISMARCKELNPLLDGVIVAGLYCATDAQVNPFKVTQAYARAAQNAGARLVSGTRVSGIEVTADRVTGVTTNDGRIGVPWIVNAAGAHAGFVGKMVGVEHPVLPRRGQIVVLEASPDSPAIRVAAAGQLLAKHSGAGANAGSANVALSYTSRLASGTVLLGSTNEFAGYDTRTTAPALAAICRAATRLMPRLGDLKVLRSWAGLRPYCASGPMLGYSGGPAGYVTAIGHGGDGVALSPITGAYIAEFIAREGERCDLAGFLRAASGESGRDSMRPFTEAPIE
jgi:glycine/D-amino acid oxidase-like deaminating enzyme